MGNIYLTNPSQNKASTPIPRSDKTRFKTSIRKGKKEHNKMRKKTNCENIILNLSACSNIGSKNHRRL